jgi:hypothetical protein
VQLTAPTFLIILGAVALAAAIAFGFGTQGVARDIVEKAYERRDEAGQRMEQQGGRSTTDTDLTTDTATRPEGSTTIEDEGRPSARPLRREE